MFCKLSEKIINTQKSFTVFSKNTPPKFMRLLSKILGLKHKDKLGTYLGGPMEIDGSSLQAFKALPMKVTSTISSWKFNNLSQAGKLILINSILIVFASHTMAVFNYPKFILKQVTSLLLKYWWASNNTRKPIYWKKKNTIIIPPPTQALLYSIKFVFWGKINPRGFDSTSGAIAALISLKINARLN